MRIKKNNLKKELSLPFVFAIAAGTTLSSGFFLLPGIAAAEAGKAMVISYLIAAIPLIPAMLCISELGTAMPRAGGAYYFIDRSIGPLYGTVVGIGTWLALILKTSFALIGMGAYMGIFLPNLNILPIAIFFALAFGLINIIGAKQSGKFQIIMVFCLLTILVGFIGLGGIKVDKANFNDFFSYGFHSIVSTAGMVYISYVGVTNVASIAEEVKNPERTLPLGIMLAMGTSILIYVLGTLVIVGVVPLDRLAGDLTPVASAAKAIFGDWGVALMVAAAILAFFSVANAGILSASRYPMAMSRDKLMPRFFNVLNKFHTPTYSVIFSVGLVILSVALLDPIKIAKIASSFQLLILASLCLAVIVMRESRIHSYDPGYKSPFYPWLQIFGVVSPLWLLSQMGMALIGAAAGIVVLGIAWFVLYAKKKTFRTGAIYHIFARLGKKRFEGLDSELRAILKEKGLREHDPFDMLVSNAEIIEIEGRVAFSEVIRVASERLGGKLELSEEKLFTNFMEGTKIGATPVSHGVALPHIRLHGIDEPSLLIIRSMSGVDLPEDIEVFEMSEETEPIVAFFFLISPDSDPAQHLRILAKIADRVDDDDFMHEWLGDKTHQELKEILLRDERFISLTIQREGPTNELFGKKIRETEMPDGSLITMIHRDGKLIVPRGRTVIEGGDRLTIIGEPKGIKALKKKYIV